MTIYQSEGLVIGQPVSPFFGAQNGRGAAPAVSQPTQAPVAGGMQATGVQMPILEAVSRGLIPRNAIINSVVGVNENPGGGGGGIGGDNPPIDQAMACGNSADANTTGAFTPGAANTPSTAQGVGVLNNQIFSDGVTVSSATTATGPTSENIASVTQCALSGARTTADVALIASGFVG